uniref:Uncharacterized protein n=1 Tax=Glossina palpalis gambiensis TaxID=67801 RepID=A0A1B0AQV5_9MUSC
MANSSFSPVRPNTPLVKQNLIISKKTPESSFSEQEKGLCEQIYTQYYKCYGFMRVYLGIHLPNIRTLKKIVDVMESNYKKQLKKILNEEQKIIIIVNVDDVYVDVEQNRNKKHDCMKSRTNQGNEMIPEVAKRPTFLNEESEGPIHLLFNEINKNKEYSNISAILKKRGFDLTHSSPLAPFNIFSDKIVANLKASNERGKLTSFQVLEEEYTMQDEPYCINNLDYSDNAEEIVHWSEKYGYH